MKQKLTELIVKAHLMFSQKKLMKKHTKKSNVIIEVRNTGMGRMMDYHRIFCDHCQKNLLSSLINSISDFFADIDNPNITHILQNWDILNLQLNDMDIVGCFLPWDENVHAGPNARYSSSDQLIIL